MSPKRKQDDRANQRREMASEVPPPGDNAAQAEQQAQPQPPVDETPAPQPPVDETPAAPTTVAPVATGGGGLTVANRFAFHKIMHHASLREGA